MTVAESLHAEKLVAAQIRLHTDLKSKLVGDYNAAYDLVAGNVRIEVKAAPLKNKKWRFNIHRHGVVDERDVDVYVLVLEGLMKYRLYCVIPAPLNTPTLEISLRGLFGKFAKYVGNWDAIARSDNTRTE